MQKFENQSRLAAEIEGKLKDKPSAKVFYRLVIFSNTQWRCNLDSRKTYSSNLHEGY